MHDCKVISVSKSTIPGIDTPGQLIAHAARVSNPDNQFNHETAPKLLAYLARNKHWSPFEMVTVVMEVNTTRDIGRQILRHRSFSFQEFSQRYAVVENRCVKKACRLQHPTNRQASLEGASPEVTKWWDLAQQRVESLCKDIYEEALAIGIAKEQARAVLPEGITATTMYMSGTVRSWMHFIQLRTEAGTQKEHRDVAESAKDQLLGLLPELTGIL